MFWTQRADEDLVPAVGIPDLDDGAGGVDVAEHRLGLDPGAVDALERGVDPVAEVGLLVELVS